MKFGGGGQIRRLRGLAATAPCDIEQLEHNNCVRVVVVLLLAIERFFMPALTRLDSSAANH